MSSLWKSLHAVLEMSDLPFYLQILCEELRDALILMVIGAIDTPGPAHVRRGRRGRPPATASRAGGVNLIIATVAEEFCRRFGRAHWDDVRRLLCFIAPGEFRPDTSSETLRKRAKSVSDKQVRVTLARCFP